MVKMQILRGFPAAGSRVIVGLALRKKNKYQALSIEEEKEIEALRYENHRLRNILEENLKLFQNISQSPSLTKDCPADLYKRLEAAVESTKFLNQLESLHQASNNFPFEETTEADLVTVEILVNGERSRWVWVTDEKLVEERSGIDNETYVIVSEDDVVEGVANFMAKCIISNPKTQKLTPQELQKNRSHSVTFQLRIRLMLGFVLPFTFCSLDDCCGQGFGRCDRMEQLMNIWHAGTMFYGLAMWGLALSGLYRHRGVLKVAAKRIGASGKLVMKAL
ncbi:hypothetical protein C5167_049039 [Papaver somniferum]|uniref:Uncharacterized protein n=1 Tax=Papaver somniferum TaxID=3469 RepID=A0A4Y7KNP1_PAPSO|nr:hypothetical protein C5167_049039 [Papaver somniferum]